MKTIRNITILGVGVEPAKSEGKKPCNEKHGGRPHLLQYRITDGDDGWDCEPHPNPEYKEVRFREFGVEEWTYAEIKSKTSC